MTSFVSGVLSGLAGPAGPPFIILVIFYNFSRMTFLGTYLLSRILTSIQVLVMLLLGSTGYTEELIPSVAGSLVGGFIGAMFGTEISKRVNQDVFIAVLQTILFVSSLLIILDETGIEIYAMLVALLLISVHYFVKRCVLNRQIKDEHQRLKESSVQTYDVGEGEPSDDPNFTPGMEGP